MNEDDHSMTLYGFNHSARNYSFRVPVGAELDQSLLIIVLLNTIFI